MGKEELIAIIEDLLENEDQEYQNSGDHFNRGKLEAYQICLEYIKLLGPGKSEIEKIRKLLDSFSKEATCSFNPDDIIKRYREEQKITLKSSTGDFNSLYNMYSSMYVIAHYDDEKFNKKTI